MYFTPDEKKEIYEAIELYEAFVSSFKVGEEIRYIPAFAKMPLWEQRFDQRCWNEMEELNEKRNV